MNKEKEINSFYKILVLYEDMVKGCSGVTVDSYLNYLDKLYVKWLGTGNAEIYNTIKGLWTLGIEAEHRTVKSTVFHMIGLIEKDVI